MAVREFDGELDAEPSTGSGFREFTGVLDGEEPKKPGLVDTLNQAGFFPASPRAAAVDPKAAAQPYGNWQRDPKAISAPGSVMDGFVPQDRSGERTAENDVGPMRADSVEKIKQQLRNDPSVAQKLSESDSRLAPLAGRVVAQQQKRRDRGGLPATRDDVLSDVEQGSLPYDPQMKQGRSFGDAAKDSGKQLVEGAVGIADSVTNLVAPDSAFAAQTGALRQDWYDAQSPEMKSALEEIDAKVKAAGKEGLWEEIKTAAVEYGGDPAVAARLAMTNIASIVPGLAVGKVAKASSLARGATALQAGAAATTAAGATNAVLNGGSARGEAFDELKKAYLAQGLSESEATKKALSESWVAGGVGAATGFVSGKFGGAEKALLNGASGALGRKAAATAAGKAFVTEQLGEQVEELSPQLTTNLLLNRIDGRSVTQGLGSTAVQTAIGAGPMSAVGGVAEYANARSPNPVAQPGQKTDEPSSLDSSADDVSRLHDQINMLRTTTGFPLIGKSAPETDFITPNAPKEADPELSEQRDREVAKADAQVTFAIREAFTNDDAVTYALNKAEAENATLADKEAADQAVQEAFARNPEVKNNAFTILEQLRNQGSQDVAQAPQAKQAEAQGQEQQPAAAVAPAAPVAATKSVIRSNVPLNQRGDGLVATILKLTGGKGIAESSLLDITSDTRKSKVAGLFTKEGQADLSDPHLMEGLNDAGYLVRSGEDVSNLIRSLANGEKPASVESMIADADKAEKAKYRNYILEQAEAHKLKGIGANRSFSAVATEVHKLLNAKMAREEAAQDEAASAAYGASVSESKGIVSDDDVAAIVSMVFDQNDHLPLHQKYKLAAEKVNEATNAGREAKHDGGAAPDVGRDRSNDRGIADDYEIPFSNSRSEALYTEEGTDDLANQVFPDVAAGESPAQETAAPRAEAKNASPDSKAHREGSKERTIQEALTTKEYSAPEITLHSGLKPAGKITRATFKALNQVARIFKQNVVYYSADRRSADGFLLNGTIYINVNSTVSVQALLGHELTHRLKKEMPNAWTAVAETLAKRMSRDKLISMYRSYNADESIGKNDAQIAKELNKDGAIEHLMGEMVSDFAGNQFTDAKFWGDVFGEIIAVHPEGVAKRLIERLRLAVMKMIGLMNAAISQRGFNRAWLKGETDATAADAWLNEANAALKTAYAKWIIRINEQGYQQAQGDAQVQFAASPFRDLFDDMPNEERQAIHEATQRNNPTPDLFSQPAFNLTGQTNKEAAAEKSQKPSEEITKEQADKERDAVPFSLEQESQPKPVGVQGGLFSQSNKDAAKIDDFGEKLDGARKHTWSSSLSEVADDDVAASKLSEAWPHADYQGLIDGGADPLVVGLVRSLRDSIPSKPRLRGNVSRWAATVVEARKVANDIIEGKIASSALRVMKDVYGRAELYAAVGHEKSLEGMTFAHRYYTLYKGKENVNFWSVEGAASSSAFSNFPQEIAKGDTKEAALDAFKAVYAKLGSESQAKKSSYVIFSERGKVGYFVGKKVGRNTVTLSAAFPTVKEARDYRENNADALDKALAKFKEIPNERRDTNNPRVGEDMRGGMDATPEMFGEAFGFRGVQFGNWVEQKKRQSDLNDAYDALMDMAAVLGIPAKAISLNGDLGLAFGARGSGGTNAAAAHYEPDTVVINLTKKNGAGSLGHEWWHGLDGYFARQRNKGLHMTDALDVSLSARGSNFVPYPGVRREMVEAFGAVMRAIAKTDMAVRSRNLDNKRTKDYWGDKAELSARAFEAYLISKLQDQNAANDYLANIVDEKVWDAAAALGMENENSYPYPTEPEIPSIRAGFDQLFETIQHKETDKGVALFSPARYAEETADIPQKSWDALGDFWLNVAQHKDLFYYPTTDAKTIEKAFEDVVVKKNPSFSIEPVSTTNIEEVGKAPSESGDKVWAIWDGTNLLGKIHERGNEVWISVAGMVSGSGGGASVYSAVGQYAHNTGKEFIGDPAGFDGTPGARLGEIRRVEHLISQALRYGSTDHVTLGDDHVANKGWKKGNFRENLDLLLKESYANYEWLFEASPKLAQVKFDVQSEQFTINGRPVSDFHFKALLGHQTRGISGVSGNVGRGTPGVVRGARIGEAIGVSTAKRAIVAKTILEGMDSSAAGRILDGIDAKLDAKGLAAESGIRRVQYSNPRFVSQLATQIDNVPSRLEVQPATQWRLWLDSNAAKLGIKKDEIEWSGVKDYLAMRGKEKVSKAEIAAFLSENGTQVQDVVLGEAKAELEEYITESDIEITDDSSEYWMADGDVGNKLIAKWHKPTAAEAKAFAVDYFNRHIKERNKEKTAAADDTKFAKYVVPGGERYRELLVTLPRNDYSDEIEALREKYITSKSSEAQAIKSQLAELKAKRDAAQFKSSHFDQPNILVHLRMDERTDADGNPTLFLQELQSDWGQEGKKEGFATKETELPSRPASYSEIIVGDEIKGWGKVQAIVDGKFDVGGLLIGPEKFELSNVADRNVGHIDKGLNEKRVPTAPFVTDTKSWVALGMKRAIMYAVQHGMTRVAWANGAQNAGHYDLSKQIDSIEYVKARGGETVSLDAIKDGRLVFSKANIPMAEIEDHVGKDVAQKIEAGEGETNFRNGKKELSGLDLKVGGEGMAKFYNEIVPQVANDVLKKLGGGKVEAVSIAKDFGGINPKTGKPRGANFSDENRLMQQQGFTITDSMKAKVSEGVPLFSPSRSALTGQPIRGANFTLPSETKAQESQRLIQDATNRWEIVQAAVLEQGGTIDDDTNVARAIQLYPGRVGASFEDLNHRLVEPLLERMARTGATMDQIGTYLYALHAPERNAEMAKKNPRFPDGGSGMTNSDAAQLVANFRALPNFAEIDAVAKGFQALTKRRLAFMVRAGVMSQEQMDAYQAAYKAYVPLKGFEDMDENGKPTGSGKGFSTGNKIDKRALGRESRAGQIIENIVRDFEAGLILAEKANVGRVVKAFVEANPDAKLWEVDNPPVEQQMSTAGNVFLKTAQYNPEAEIQFLENGKPVRVQIYDKILLRAYNNIGAKELDAVSKTFNIYNSWLRQMYTQKNPAWFVLNFLKDQQSAAMYMTGEKGAGFALKNLTKMPKAMSLAWAMYHNKPMSAANQALVNDFRRSGGMTGFAYVGDIEAKANQLQGALAKYQTWGETKSQGMKALMTKAINNKFFDYIAALNTTFENTTRLATFMTAIESGASSKEAAQLAKNVTVNFNVHGEYGPSINAWYLFANAGIQGTRNIGHALFYSPHKAQVWALASGAVMLGVLAGIMSDDDDDLIDDSTRSRALVIKVGDSKVLIPTAYGWGFFTSMGQLVAQAMKHPDKREKIALKMASSAFDHFGFFGNPVAGDELSLKSAVANTTPTAVRPFVQSATNTSSFGGPLYPESQFNPTQPDSEKAWRKTKGSAYDQFAKWMNSVSGGDAAQEGAVSVSPESLKQMTSTLGGGALRLVTDMLSLPVEAANNGGVKAKNVPVLKSFYQAIDVDDYRRQFGEASANAEETLRVANNYKKAASKPEASQSVKDAKKDYDKENQHLIAAGRMVTSYRKRIASLRDAEDKLRAEKDPSEAQRLELMQNTARQIAAVKQFNVLVNKANNNSSMPVRQ